MTNVQKQEFCTFAAALMAPPDPALLEDLRQTGLREQITEYVREWGSGGPVTSQFTEDSQGDDLLSSLQREYGRLFGEHEGARISLVESTYKPWTLDKSCGMVFAASTGLLMGDPAAHMLNIYERLSLEFPEDFRSTPDHLILEVELLAMLYQSASQDVIEGFIKDHLDWIPELSKQMEMADAHPFYRNAVEMIRLFVKNESDIMKGTHHGEKRIH
jgi:putative dimethyl sulfoxide reductase chaperone